MHHRGHGVNLHDWFMGGMGKFGEEEWRLPGTAFMLYYYILLLLLRAVEYCL